MNYEDEPPAFTREQMVETCEQARMQVSMMPKWKQGLLGGPVFEHHISPNGARPGSLYHAAEAWLLSEGLIIPDQNKHPLIYQAMLDEFIDSVAFAKWEAGE